MDFIYVPPSSRHIRIVRMAPATRQEAAAAASTGGPPVAGLVGTAIASPVAEAAVNTQGAGESGISGRDAGGAWRADAIRYGFRWVGCRDGQTIWFVDLFRADTDPVEVQPPETIFDVL